MAEASQSYGRRGRAARWRASVIFDVAVVIALGVLLPGSMGGASTPSSPSRSLPAGHHATTIAAVESGLLPWTLTAPISRAIALPGLEGHLVVLGGLTSSNISAQGIYSLDTATGTLVHKANLISGLHDSSGAVIAGQDVAFGGGSPATIATVQSVPLSATGSGVVPVSTVIGSLPQPRSDSATVTFKGTTYIVGGYDGTNPDRDVLATTDGHSFSAVASLKKPVRYPAVAALHGLIYVFGGQAIIGADAGQPVNTIQVVNPRLHTVSLIGRLPIPLAAASAVTVRGKIYVAGGETTVAQPTSPGIGTTQLGPPPLGANPGAGATSDTLSAATTRGKGTLTLGTSLAATFASSSSGSIGPEATPGTSSVSTIWAYNSATHKLPIAGRLQVPVSHSSAAVIGTTAWFVGGESNGAEVSTVQMLTPNQKFGTAGASGAGSPYFGLRLLIADRGNNRFLLMNAAMHITWTYPSATSPSDPYGFVFPDDAFFIDKGRAIISNQEENETIIEIGYPSGKVLWEYGHPKQPGSVPGYLHEPDDAYLLKNGQITVADAQNCRVVIINHDGTVGGQIGTTGRCVHSPPTSMGSPNGDTPLVDGNILISEINGSWISEYTLKGQLVWTTHVPVVYPSDPQQLGPDLYLVADYAKPGAFIYTNRTGQILYRYYEASGPGMLNHPSLAERLPSGVVMINDDYANRMVAIDPKTGALVWQYGVTDAAGTAAGMLNTPDGFDVLEPDGSSPTHPMTG
jgi:outer membrane protein assembly factor BamB